MEREIVTILDTTLRDGLRNSGVTMTLEEKLRVARWLEEIGASVFGQWARLVHEVRTATAPASPGR